MKISIEIAGKGYRVAAKGIDLSIPLRFDGPQPNTYGVPKATARAYEQDGWVGDTRRGGGCNFETYTLTPHCNGTHTECIGHITDARIPVCEVLRPGLVPATLVTVEPLSPSYIRDGYDPSLNPHDLVIDRESLESALQGTDPAFLHAVIVRTLPNEPGKLGRDYMEEPPAFFSNEAMEYLAGLELTHLLVDLPSVDRLFDEGKLSNHHLFWGMPQGSRMADAAAPQARMRTITEMIFVPHEATDGRYLLDLQIAPFMSDAAPSRPVIFEATNA